MTRAGVVGATGYAGAELVRILAGHPNVELTVITSRQYAGTAFDRIYPAMKDVVRLVCEAFSPESVCDRADVIFTALPHKIPMDIVPGFAEKGKRVVDLSADFRFRNVDAYEAAYQPHSSRSLSEKAVYGLSEIYGDEIRKADIVGNPGCYPTSVLLPLIPLIRRGLVDTSAIVSDSKSGVSGAGRSPSVTSLFCEAAESFKAYKVASHRHNPEMNEVLSLQAGIPVQITFVPHLVPMSRGMLTTTYAALSPEASEPAVRKALCDFYADSPFVRLCPEGAFPNTLHVRGTNYCDIGFTVDEAASRLILISAIDNLVKGAAGQAVQNMNLMMGMPETDGLDQVPYPL